MALEAESGQVVPSKTENLNQTELVILIRQAGLKCISGFLVATITLLQGQSQLRWL